MNEADLCKFVKKNAEEYGFEYYPEFEDWDIVIRRKRVVIGIQAKLRLNVKAIAQCLRARPINIKCILTANPISALNNKNPIWDYLPILRRCKIVLLVASEDGFITPYPGLYNLSNRSWLIPYYTKLKKKIYIPNFTYETPAGVRSPRRVTEMNIAKVLLELEAEKNGGYVTLADARGLGLDRVPPYYYTYDWNTRRWRMKEFPKASLDYPHIFKGVTSG